MKRLPGQKDNCHLHTPADNASGTEAKDEAPVEYVNIGLHEANVEYQNTTDAEVHEKPYQTLLSADRRVPQVSCCRGNNV